MINFPNKLLIIIKRANRCESSRRGLEDVRGPHLWRGAERDATAPRKSPPVSTAPDVHCNAAGEISRPTYSRNITVARTERSKRTCCSVAARRLSSNAGRAARADVGDASRCSHVERVARFRLSPLPLPRNGASEALNRLTFFFDLKVRRAVSDSFI